MKKIPSLFCRNYEGDRLVRDDVVEGCEWVAAGEGVATRKWNGTCCLIRGGVLYKRYDAKRGKTPPAGFEPAQDYDETTGHLPGWIPVTNVPDDRWHREAVVMSDEWPCGERDITGGLKISEANDGTYELLGPKIQGNPEGFAGHVLMPHGKANLGDVPRDYAGIREWLAGHDIEGIVFWHPDGRACKVKGKDFGLRRIRR